MGPSAIEDAGWLAPNKLRDGRFVFEHVMEPAQCASVRQLFDGASSHAVKDNAGGRFDSRFIGFTEMVTKLYTLPAFLSNRRAAGEALENFSLLLNNIRRVAGHILGFSQLRFECTNVYHRWWSDHYRGNELHAMGFHFDNCLVSITSELKALANNMSVPDSVLDVHCKRTLDFTMFRAATAVLFLTDEGIHGEGGELVLADHGVRSMVRGLYNKTHVADSPQYMRVAASCGRLVIFRGDQSNPHAVGRLRRGERLVTQLFMVPGLPFSLPNMDLEHSYWFAAKHMFFAMLGLHIRAFLPLLLPWRVIAALFAAVNVAHALVFIGALFPVWGALAMPRVLASLYVCAAAFVIWAIHWAPFVGMVFPYYLLLVFLLYLNPTTRRRVPPLQLGVRLVVLVLGVFAQLAILF